MKPWLKRVVIGVVVVAPLVLFVGVERIRGHRQLAGLLAGLKSRGETLSISALEAAKPEWDANGFNDLANNMPGDFRARLNRGFESPPMFKFASPGHVVTMRQIQVWTSDIRNTRDWKEIGAELGDSADILEYIRAAARKPGYQSSFDFHNWSASTLLPWLSDVKKTVLYFAMAALYDLHGGKLDAASENLLDMMRLVNAQGSERLVIGQLVRNSTASIAFDVTWQALQVPGWTDSQLAAWQAAWTAFDPGPGFLAATKMDRAVRYVFFEKIRGSGEKLAAELEERERADAQGAPDTRILPTHGLLLSDIHVPLWRMAWAEQDEARSLAQMNRAVENAGIAGTNCWAAVPGRLTARLDENVYRLADNLDGASGYDRMRYLFSGGESVVSDRTIFRLACVVTEQRMAVTAIALARYQLKNGAPPAELAALVPQFLPAVPKDGMDGKPLRYRLLPDKHFLLYSVGLDCQDDGGDAALRPGKEHFGTIWDGKDAVWPQAAADADAAPAMEADKERFRR